MSTYKARKNAAQRFSVSTQRLLSTTAIVAAGAVALLPSMAIAGDGPVGDYDVWQFQNTQASDSGLGYVEYTGDTIIDNLIQEDIGTMGHVHLNARLTVATGVESGPMNILGKLTSTGEVKILDVNGFLFGQNSVVDTQGFAAIGGSIRNADTLLSDGKLDIDVAQDASITIEEGAMISVGDAGLASFVAPFISNSGIINARMGTVEMAAGQSVTLDLYGDALVELVVEGEIADALIENKGTIQAEGGRVQITALAAKDAVDNIINLDGVVTVASATQAGGKIVLSGGEHGTVKVSGKLDASGTDGGNIEIDAQNTIATAESEIKADGFGDGETEGRGGNITLWGRENAIYAGSISSLGNDGFIETSGGNLGVWGAVSIGAGGEWLLDPTNITVVGVAGDPVPALDDITFSPDDSANDSIFWVGDAAINSALDNGADVTLQTHANGVQAGNILVRNDAAINKTAGDDSTLSLQAHNDITIEGTINASGAGKLNVELIADFDLSGGDADVFIRNDIGTNGGDFLAQAADDIDVVNGATVSTVGGNATFTSRGTGDGSWLWMTGSGAIETNDGDVEVTVDNVNIAAGSSIDAGAGNVAIKRDVNGTIGLGAASGDMELTQAELARIDAGTLTVGGSNTSSISVEDVDTTSSTIAGLVTLITSNITGPFDHVNFAGTNVFNALTVNSDDDIVFADGAGVVTETGDATFNGDSNNGSVGDFVMGENSSLITNGHNVVIDSLSVVLEDLADIETEGGNVDITTSDEFGSGTVDIGANAHIDADGGDITIDNEGIFTSEDSDSLTTHTDGTISVHQFSGGSLQNAIDAMGNDGTGQNNVFAHAGTYTESLDINQANLKLTGLEEGAIAGPDVIIEGTIDVNAANFNLDPVVVDALGASYGLIATGVGADGLVVDGNTFRNSTNAGIFVARTGASTGDIKNNIFEGSATRGVRTGTLGGGYELNITDNTIGSDGDEVVNGLLFGRINAATVNIFGGSIDSANGSGPIDGDGINFTQGLHSGAEVNIGNITVVSDTDEAIDFHNTVRAGATANITGGAYEGGNNGVEFGAIAGDVNITSASIDGNGADKRGVNLLGSITGALKIVGSSIIGGDDAIGSNDAQNNTVNGGSVIVRGTTLGAKNGDGIELGAVSNGATIDIDGETRIWAEDNGVHFVNGVDASTVNIKDVNIFAEGNGILFGAGSPSVSGGSAITISGKGPFDSGINAKKNGIVFEGSVEGGSSVTIDDALVKTGDVSVTVVSTGVGSYSLSAVNLNDPSPEAGDAIQFNGVDGATIDIKNSSIDATNGDAIAFNAGSPAVDASTVNIIDNTSIKGSAHGVVFSGDLDGADINITGNSIEAGGHAVIASDIELLNGTTINVDNNTKIASTNGIGVVIEDDTVGGATVSVSGNSDISSGLQGVKLGKLVGATVDGNTIDNTGSHAIHVWSSENTEVTNNTIGTNGAINGDGVLLEMASHGSNIKGNTITQTDSPSNSFGNGIQVLGSNNVTVGGDGAEKNIITDVDWDGIRVVNADNINIRKNEITNAQRTGIYGKNLTNSKIVRNKINGTNSHHGIHLKNGDTVSVHRNRVDNVKQHGIITDGTGNLRVTRNNVDDTGKDGIHIKKSHGAQVLKNKVGTDGGAGNIGEDGIHINGSNNAVVQANQISNTVANGILVNPSDNATIGGATEEEGNTIADVGENGIKILGGTGHNVRYNNIRRAGKDGIRVEDFGNAWIAYNDIKWTGDDGIDVHDGNFVSIYNNYIDLSGYLPNTSGPFPANVEVGEDANGIHVVNVGGGDLPEPVVAEDGFGYGAYGASVEIHGNDIANSEDDGIQVEGRDGDIKLIEPEEGGYSAYIADNIIGHVGDDGIDVDDVDHTVVARNAITLAGDKGITIDGGHYAGVFDNRVLLTGNDGIQVENIRYDHDTDIAEFGDVEHGYGWAVNVSGNEVAMTGDDGIEVKNSDATKVAHNNIFMAGMGEGLGEVIDQINTFANGTFSPIFALKPDIPVEYYNGFEWQWGDGHGINVHDVDGAYYSPNGWAADIRGNNVKYTGGHGILAEDNDRTRIKNNTVKYAGIDYTNFHGAHNMLEVLNAGPFHSEGRRDLWMSTDESMITVLEGYFGADEEPEEETDYISITDVGFDSHDGIHAENIYGQYSEGISGNNYLYDLKIKGNTVKITGDDGIEVVNAGRTLIAENTVRDSGHGEDEDYGSGDYYGADGIHVRNVSVHGLFDADKLSKGLKQNEDGSYNYEPAQNYALIVRNNDVRRTADDGIEVVGYGEGSGPESISVAGISDGPKDGPSKDGPYYIYGGTDRVLIAENTVRRTGDDAESDSYYGSDLGPDGYGHDGIHVRGIEGGHFYGAPVRAAGEGTSGGGGLGFYGYAVDIIDNDVRRTGDDGIEVIESASTLILDNTVRLAGLGGGHYGNGDYYGADGIHVRNVGGFNGFFLDFAGESGKGFQPYAVAIVDNDVRKTRDDGIEVVGEFFEGGEGVSDDWEGPWDDYGYGGGTGRTLIAGNTVRDAGILDDYYYGGTTGRDGHGHDGIHVRGVENNFFGFPGEYAGGEGPEGFYGYAVDIIENDVRRTADDGIEVADSESTLIAGNTVRRAGEAFGDYGFHDDKKHVFDDYGFYHGGSDYYGADGIHVRNVGGNDDGPFWSPASAGGDGFQPYAVVIAGNNVRKTRDDGIEVVGEAKVFFPDTVLRITDDEGPYYPRPKVFGGTGRTLILANKVRDAGGYDDGGFYKGDRYGADGIHVRGVYNLFEDRYDGPYEGTSFAGGPGHSGYDIQIIGNKVKDSMDDGIEVRGLPFVQTDLLVERNEVENSGDNGILLVAQGGRIETGPGDDFAPSVSLIGPYGFGEFNSDIFDNTVTNSGTNGLHVNGYGHGEVVLEGNTFINNPVGARFESGEIDLTGRTNNFIVTPDYVLPEGDYYYDRPEYDYVTGMQFELAGVGDPTILTIKDKTLGTTAFSGFINRPVGSAYYVRFEDGAILDKDGNVIVIDGTMANWDGVIPTNFGNVLPANVLQAIEDRLWDADDPLKNGRGQIFVGTASQGIDNVEDFFNRFGPFASGLSGLNLRVTGLPSVSPLNLAGIEPFAGEGDPENVADIEPAAGGDDGEGVADIEPAAGGEDAACWGEVLSAAVNGAVNYSFSSDPAEALADAVSCGS